MQCTKCSQEMEKESTYKTGEASFERYRCTNCWTEQTKAIGVNMPE